MACRTFRFSVLVLSWPSRFWNDGTLTVRMPDWPWNDFHSDGLICSTNETCPARSSWAAVVSCDTTPNTTFLKCGPDQPPQYPGKALRTTSNSWPLFQVCSSYGPVPASCGVLNHLVSALLVLAA